MSNPKSGMVLEVTLIPNVLMNIVTKFQVSIFKNDEVRGGVTLTPPPLHRISWQRGLHGIGLIKYQINQFNILNIYNEHINYEEKKARASATDKFSSP